MEWTRCGQMYDKVYCICLREGIKKNFFWRDLSQIWVGGVADFQTRFQTLKKKTNRPENRLFQPKFHLSFSQISQKHWGGWMGKQIWERFLYLPFKGNSQKKYFVFHLFMNSVNMLLKLVVQWKTSAANVASKWLHSISWVFS